MIKHYCYTVISGNLGEFDSEVSDVLNDECFSDCTYSIHFIPDPHKFIAHIIFTEDIED